MENCIFCKIVNGELPSTKLYEDENILAFKDISPATPVHILIIPKQHIESAKDIDSTNSVLVAKCFEVIAKLGKELNLDNGYRIINNCGKDGGQIVPHLHFHLLGGIQLNEKIV